MCGHVGIAGNLGFGDEKTMKRLFLLDYFRGPDSTGFAAIRTSGEVKVAKMSSHPLDLFDSQRFKAALNGVNSTVFLGHNRLATKGLVNATNAHPYEFGHIVGAHNGTLMPSAFKALEDKLGEKYDVDSQAIFASIEKFGLEETVSMITGAWALVYINLKDGTLNFLRNKERPMWYAYSKKFDKLFWASEYVMIETAVKMEGGYELFLDKEGYSFFPMDEDLHYKFKISDLVKGSSTRPRPVVKTIKGKEVVNSNVAPFDRSGTDSLGTGATTTKDTRVNTPLLHTMYGDDTNPFGGALSREAFDEIARHGCSWCQGDIGWGELGVTVNTAHNYILCSDCSPATNGTNRVLSPSIHHLL